MILILTLALVGSDCWDEDADSECGDEKDRNEMELDTMALNAVGLGISCRRSTRVNLFRTFFNSYSKSQDLFMHVNISDR